MSVSYSKYLDNINADFDKIISRVDSDFKALDEFQFNWKPNADAWSIAQCLEHLRILGLVFIPQFKTQMSAFTGEIPSINKPYRHSFIAKRVISFIGPNSSFRARTSKRFEPEFSNYTLSALDDFVSVQLQLKNIVEQSRSIHPSKVTMPLPAASFLRLGLGDMLKFVLEHEIRHMNQAERVKKIIGFPPKKLNQKRSTAL